MSLITWIERFFKGDQTEVSIAEAAYWDLAASIYVRELAFESAVNLVAKLMAKCPINTYKDNQRVYGPEYYRWNVRPNRNQSSSDYMSKMITKLYRNNEALVVESADRQLLVADSFTMDKSAFYDYKFTNVIVDGYPIRKTFYMNDVLYYKLNNSDVAQLITGLHESYGKLAEYAQKAYLKSRGQKGILSIGSRASGTEDFAKTLEDMMNNKFKTYFEADNAVMPLTEGYEYEEQDRKTYNADSTRDIRALVDDTFVFTARPFGIAPSLLLGDVADTSKAMESTLTVCIDPLCDLIETENNGKLYTKNAFLKGSYQKFDTKQIKHVDLLSVSSGIDKLISSGAFCINDIRKLVGDEPINEEWANQHWMTKNYAPTEEIMKMIQE